MSDDVHTAAKAAIEAARLAQKTWGARTAKDRARRLKAAGQTLLAGAEELARILEEETHKPLGEAYAGDVVGVGDLFTYWCAQGPKHLAPRKARISALDMPGKKGRVEREPVGVVGVISPWNYPVALPMRVIVPALLAGNAVVFKPSEHTPRCGVWMAERLREHLGDVVQVLQGDGAMGAALIEAGPDVVHFTGSTATGRKVAVRCAELGIGCELELGGKDAALVLDDALLDRTARGIAWGIVHNAGQDCASIERVLVHQAVADRFVPLLTEAVQATASQVPELVTAQQKQIVIGQIEDAIAKGATVLCGGVPGGDDPVPPTLVTDLPREATMWREESFGPVAVVEVCEDDEALIQAANDCAYGLGASLWSQDVARACGIGHRVRTGMLWINNHAFTGAIPDLPWVGRRGSGSGITSSPETLLHLTRPRVVVLDKSTAPEPWWYPYGPSMEALMRAVVGRHHTGGLGATIATLRALMARNKALSED